MREIQKYAQKICDRMKTLTDDKFEFEYKITDEGIEFITEDYFALQDDGVKGLKSGSSKAGYKFDAPYNIPPSAFAKYTSDKNKQFAIARSVENRGITPKNYVDKFNKDKIIFGLLEDIYAEFIKNIIDEEIKN
jgi:hypothetical protein